MLVLNIAMKHEEARRIVESLSEEIVFVKRDGMSLYFSTPNDLEYTQIVKRKLKSSEGFSALYFNLIIK